MDKKGLKQNKLQQKRNFFENNKKRVFLDFASATPIRPEVQKAMLPFFGKQFVNPSALYGEAVHIRSVIDASRKEIAAVIRAHSDEIIFTSSGTESDNLAVFGIVEASRKYIKNPHIIISAFEHPAILEAAKALQKKGVRVSYAAVSSSGFVNPKAIQDLLTPETVLVSVMYANNEIGTIQDTRGIAREIRHYKKNKKKKHGLYPYFHTDSGQALLFCDSGVDRLGVDLMTIDAAKLYGPKGSSALFVRRGVEITPLVFGGGQEEGRRSGTESVMSIVGLSKALALSEGERISEAKRLTRLRDSLYKKIMRFAPDAHLNGSLESRLPNNLNICFEGIDSEYLVLKLDSRGFAVSSSSSCRSITENNSSYVIKMLSGTHPCDTSSLRITLGKDTTELDIKNFAIALRDALRNP